jgi:hypothetical protein
VLLLGIIGIPRDYGLVIERLPIFVKIGGVARQVCLSFDCFIVVKAQSFDNGEWD